ncbi:MAG: hypothetical protein F4X18_03515 [Acidimicrobiia bacterium]|nr:hypothetical protein [Acidimicrobiia bacterium]MYC84571.1 hypothetical protein [Acidimicrobiia bacterium]
MGRQPNIRLRAAERPVEELERAPERRWTPTRPGEITSPAETPSGGSFGRPGPDTGWGLQMIRAASFDRGRRHRDLESLLSALVGARASQARRGPTRQDVEVALSLVGLHEGYARLGGVPAGLAEVREQWLDELAHDPWPGRSALGSVPADLLMDEPDRVRARLQADPSLVG